MNSYMNKIKILYTMRKILVVIFALIINFSIAQIFEGKVAEFPVKLDMTKLESYYRINNTGGLTYDKQGFISFKHNKIIFSACKSNINAEIYMELGFKYDWKMAINYSLEGFGSTPEFIMVNDNGDEVTIEYISLNKPIFDNVNVGQFVISLKDKMYILVTDTDIDGELKKIYPTGY